MNETEIIIVHENNSGGYYNLKKNSIITKAMHNLYDCVQVSCRRAKTR